MVLMSGERKPNGGNLERVIVMKRNTKANTKTQTDRLGTMDYD